MPVVEHVRSLVAAMIDEGYTDVDFAALLSVQAKAVGARARARAGPVDDGLAAAAPATRRRGREPARREPVRSAAPMRRRAANPARVARMRTAVSYRARRCRRAAAGRDATTWPDPAEEGGQ